jgi:hypothetical protein
VRSELQLIAMICCIIAAKYEEAEEKVPSIEQIISFSENSTYSFHGAVEMKRSILRQLEWNLASTTVLHCLDYYMAKGGMYDADTIKDKPLPSKAPRYFRKYALFFSEICLQEYEFQQYRTSNLAAAMVRHDNKLNCNEAYASY